MSGALRVRTILIENVVQPALLFFLIPILRFVTVLRSLAGIGVLRRRLPSGGGGGAAPFDNLVQFTAVKPDAASLRAIVNLDALPIAHR